jgi:glycosyltransferase involved in cell wall biosynthesis
MYPDYSDSNSYQRKLKEGLRERGYDVRLSHGSHPFPLLGALRRHGRPELFHVHWLHRHFVTDSSVLTLLLGLRLLFELVVLRLLDIDVVWTVHNLCDHEYRSPRTERGVRHGAARLCDRIVVHCEAAREEVCRAYRLPDHVESRIDVVPHGHYVGSYRDDVTRSEARDRLNYEESETVFLYFGLIRPYKNVPDLVRTFSTIDDEDARLLIVGNPWSDALEREISDLCAHDDRVDEVLEFVPDDDIQLYMNAADVTVFPFSEVLTSGTTMLGMSFARPVVAPRKGCVGELVDEAGGFSYDPENPNGLRESLEAALSTDLDGMGRYNREKVDRYDWGLVARKTDRTYQRAGCDPPRRLAPTPSS